jgi:hypothetical protein
MGAADPDFLDPAVSAGYVRDTKAGVVPTFVKDVLIASRGYGRRVRWRGGEPTRLRSIYRVIWRPTVAEIVGDGRPWTVLMISLLSMPWRYTLVMPRLSCPS